MELKCFTPTQTLANRSGQRWWLMCQKRKWKIVSANKLLDIFYDLHCFILWSFNFLSYYMEKTDSQIEKSFKHTKRSSSTRLHLNRINLLFQNSLFGFTHNLRLCDHISQGICVCPAIWGICTTVMYHPWPVGQQDGDPPRKQQRRKKKSNMLLWCSQQGIRRFLLTGLKQYIPFFCPAAPHVLLRDGVFLSFPFSSFSLHSFIPLLLLNV